MILVHHTGLALSKRIRAGSIVGGVGWRCGACGYESRTVFTNAGEADTSHRYHTETWCSARAA